MAHDGRAMLFLVEKGRYAAVEQSRIYWLEATGERTRVRLSGSKSLWDQRRLGVLESLFEKAGFLRIHRNHMVNLLRIAEVRRRTGGRGWEVKLEPPVNRVLPVSASAVKRLFEAFDLG